MSDHANETQQLWEIAAIREALGVGPKPMLSDLPRIVAERNHVLRLIPGELEHWADLLMLYGHRDQNEYTLEMVTKRMRKMAERINEAMK